MIPRPQVAPDIAKPEPASHACGHFHSGVNCEHCGIRPSSVCGALESHELMELEALARPVCYTQRQQMFAQDEPAEHVFNITSGSARLYRLLPDGRRQVVGFAIPGDFLGLSMSERTVFGAEALEPATACKFNREAFARLVEERPHLLRRLYDLASHELSLAQEQMVIIGRRTAEERVVCFLIGLRKRWARSITIR